MALTACFEGAIKGPKKEIVGLRTEFLGCLQILRCWMKQPQLTLFLLNTQLFQGLPFLWSERGVLHAQVGHLFWETNHDAVWVTVSEQPLNSAIEQLQ